MKWRRRTHGKDAHCYDPGTLCPLGGSYDRHGFASDLRRNHLCGTRLRDKPVRVCFTGTDGHGKRPYFSDGLGLVADFVGDDGLGNQVGEAGCRVSGGGQRRSLPLPFCCTSRLRSDLTLACTVAGGGLKFFREIFLNL
jgi:hypothetical protein